MAVSWSEPLRKRPMSAETCADLLLVDEEALAGLLADPTGHDERPEQRRRAVALLAPLLVEAVEYGQDVVEADLLRPLEDPARVVQTVDHARVDVGGAADALGHRERRLVDDLADDPAEHEPGRLVDPDGVLAEGGENPLGRGGRGVGRVGAAGELDQARLIERRESVKADRATAGIHHRERARNAADRLRAALERRREVLAEAEVEDQEGGLALLRRLRGGDVPAGLRRGVGERVRQGRVAGDDDQPVTPARTERWGIGLAVLSRGGRVVVVAAP